MFVRSPRRFAILACIAFVFIFAVLQQSPWAQEQAYQRIPLFDLVGRPPDGSRTTLETTHEQAPLEDAWQHAIPKPKPSPSAVVNVALPPPAVMSKAPVDKTEPQPPWVTAPSRTASFIPPTPRPSNMREYMRKMLKWPRPSWDGHWPPFGDYINKAYDPNRWEQFDMYVFATGCGVHDTNYRQGLSRLRGRTSSSQ